MKSASLELPPGMEVAPEVEIRLSEVDVTRLGIWCKTNITKDSKFGPFIGERVMEGTDDMEPSYVWEIVDLETKEFLFYINATDPKSGNWMRYINCARFYEEQNIVSQQEGTDIFYKAIKDIAPGQELLTWYERTPFRKKKRVRKSTSSKSKSTSESPTMKEQPSPVDEAFRDDTVSQSGETTPPPVSTDNLDIHVSQRGRRRKVTKYWELENLENSENSDFHRDSDIINSEDDMTIASDDDWNAASSANSKVSEPTPLDTPMEEGASDQFYQFEVMPYQVVKSWLGRKVFKCDICSGVYRHSFSLKRHYIRNHINHKYVSQSDLLHCNVTYKPSSTPVGDEDVRSVVMEHSPKSELMGSEKIETTGSNGTDMVTTEEGDSCVKEDAVTIVEEEETEAPPVDNNANKVSSDHDKCDPLDAVDSQTVHDHSDQAEKSGVECAAAGLDTIPPDTDLPLNASSTSPVPEHSIMAELNAAPSTDNLLTSTPSTSDISSLDRVEKPEHVPLITSFKPDLYRCNVCEVLFDTVAGLKKHLSNHPESSSKAFACDKCDMKFTHKQNLMRHQAVHTGARPYTCKFCDKKFPTITNQKRHERIHQGRRINCDHCNSTFSQTGDLKKHVRKLHPELFHECGFCAKYYASAELLQQHLNNCHGEDIESNVKEIKNRKEAFKVDLESDRAESMRLALQRGPSVTKEKFKFACTVCKKRFVDYANMCRHRRLAHQRHMLHLGVMKKEGGELGHANSPLRALFDPDMDKNSAFYAKVAKNIADNLKYHVEGRREELKQKDIHIKWKASDNLPSPVSDDGYIDGYNFPDGFHIQNQSSRLSRKISHAEYVKLSGLGETETTRLEIIEPEEDRSSPDDKANLDSPKTQFQCENKLVDSTQSPDKPVLLNKSPICLSSQPSKATLALKVPEMKHCKVCHCIFPNNEVYKEHMMQKHNTNLPPTVTLPCEQLLSGDDKETRALRSPPAHQKPNGLSSLMPPPPVPPGVNPNLCVSLVSAHTKQPPLAHHPHRTWSIDCKGPPLNMTSMLSPPKALLHPPNKLIDLASFLETKSWVPCSAAAAASSPSLAASSLSSSSSLSSTEAAATVPMDIPITSPTNDGAVQQQSDQAQTRPGAVPEIPSPAISQLQKPDSVDLKSQVTGDDPTLPPLKFICLACFNEFPDEVTVKAHQEDKHRTVQCKYIAVDLSYRATWYTQPNPVGALNVTSSCIPTVQTDAGATPRYTCTKCRKLFSSTSDLHAHILECGDYAKNAPQLAYIWYLRGKMITPPKKKKHGHGKFRRGRSETPQKRRNLDPKFAELSSQEATIMAQRKVLERQMSTDSPDENDAEFGRRRRRRVQELFYNPHNHIRRRDLAQLLGNKCMGCGEVYNMVSLLERHLVQCPEKEKILGTSTILARASSAAANEDDDSENNFDPTKHMCIYCEKQFTYLGMLRKHVVDVCPSRKEFVEKGEYLDEEWEHDLDVKTGHAPARSNLSRQSSISSLNGILGEDADNSQDGSDMRARKRRRKRGHNWGYKPKGVKQKRLEEDSPYMIEESFFAGNDSGNSQVLSVGDDESSNDSSLIRMGNETSVGQYDQIKPKIEPGLLMGDVERSMEDADTQAFTDSKISLNGGDATSQTVKEKLAQKIKEGGSNRSSSDKEYKASGDEEAVENKGKETGAVLKRSLSGDDLSAENAEDDAMPRKRKRRGPRLTMKRRKQSLASPKLFPVESNAGALQEDDTEQSPMVTEKPDASMSPAPKKRKRKSGSVVTKPGTVLDKDTGGCKKKAKALHSRSKSVPGGVVSGLIVNSSDVKASKGRGGAKKKMNSVNCPKEETKLGLKTGGNRKSVG